MPWFRALPGGLIRVQEYPACTASRTTLRPLPCILRRSQTIEIPSICPSTALTVRCPEIAIRRSILPLAAPRLGQTPPKGLA